MRRALALTVLVAVPAVAAEKPLTPADWAALRIADAEVRVAQERAGRLQAELRAFLLQLQVRDGAVGCQLDQEKRVWVCPEEPKK
mgnify:CR=1 FL=1